MRTLIVVISVIVFGLFGGITLAIALSGTNVVLPGLGLVIAGPLIGFIFGVLIGAIFGLIFGYIISRLFIKK